MNKPYRVATICHNDDDYRIIGHRRIRLELHREPKGYRWRTQDGTDCLIAPQPSICDAEIAALQAWGAPLWDLRARWCP